MASLGTICCVDKVLYVICSGGKGPGKGRTHAAALVPVGLDRHRNRNPVRMAAVPGDVDIDWGEAVIPATIACLPASRARAP